MLVTNYHGLAWQFLKQNGLSAGVSDMIQMVINKVTKIPKYDILIIDEYQDIEHRTSRFLGDNKKPILTCKLSQLETWSRKYMIKLL